MYGGGGVTNIKIVLLSIFIQKINHMCRYSINLSNLIFGVSSKWLIIILLEILKIFKCD